MIASTGKLHSWAERHPPDYFDDRHGYAFVCGDLLRCFFEIPRSKAYWLEVSDKPQRGEWVEGEVKTDGGVHILWRADGNNWQSLALAAERFLFRQFDLTKTPKRLWCRLVYET